MSAAVAQSSRNTQASTKWSQVSENDSNHNQPESQEFSQQSEDQQSCETKEALHSLLYKCLVTVSWVLLILSPNITCPLMGVL